VASEGFKRELVSARRTGFPKVDPRAQPVVVVGALPKNRVASKDFLSYLLLRAVEAKNESGLPPFLWTVA